MQARALGSERDLAGVVWLLFLALPAVPSLCVERGRTTARVRAHVRFLIDLNAKTRAATHVSRVPGHSLFRML